MSTRTGEQISSQISLMGVIDDLDTANFSLGNVFLIKNDGDTEITLEVTLAGMQDGETITTIFETGWNPELVKAIKLNEAIGTYNLKWGY